jgi:ribosomal protein S11
MENVKVALDAKALKRIPSILYKEYINRTLNLSTRCYRLYNQNQRINKYMAHENLEDQLTRKILNLSEISEDNLEKYKPYRLYLRIGSVYITIKSRNSFMTLTTEKGKIHYMSSTGALKSTFDGRILYKGKTKNSSVARRALAKVVSRKAWGKYFRIIDIIIRTNKRFGSTYVPFMEGLRMRPVVIRSIVYLNSRPHGYVRLKKMRRI